MRIFYVSNTRIPTEKAHGIQIIKMCEAFSQHVDEVVLIYPYRVQSAAMRHVTDIKGYYGIKHQFVFKELPSLDLAALFLRLPRHWDKIRFYIQSVSHVVFVAAWLLKQKLTKNDIIYTRDPFALPLLLCIRGRAALVFEVHTIPSGSIKCKAFSLLLKKVERLITITRSLKESLSSSMKIPQEKIIVAPDGVDLDVFMDEANSIMSLCQTPVLPLSGTIILYAGHLYPWKGIQTLLDSIQFLPSDCKVVIVGGLDEDVSYWKDYSVRNGIARVHFVGFVMPSSVYRYILAANVVVLPNSASQAISVYHTSPLKLFEYMAASRPIVASDLPSIREILKNDVNAVLVKPDNPRALAEGIQKVLNTPGLRYRLAEQARKDVQQYSWNERAERILDFIRQGCSI